MSINISERVIELLESEKGKSQNDLALEIGLAPSVISKIKTGRSQDPSAETVAALAKYFNVSADWILGLTDIKTTDKATKDLCSTFGLSESAAKVLSGEFELRETPFPSDLPDLRKDLELRDIRSTINSLLIEYEKKNKTEDRSLLELIMTYNGILRGAKSGLDDMLLKTAIDNNLIGAVKMLDRECRFTNVIQEITAYFVDKKKEAEGNNGNDTKA